MAIAMTLRGFNDLGRSGFRWIIFSTDFLRFAKNKKSLSSRSLNILQIARSNSVHLTSSFSCAAASNASLRVKVCKMMAPTMIHLHKIMLLGLLLLLTYL